MVTGRKGLLRPLTPRGAEPYSIPFRSTAEALRAEVAELADALGSGSSGRKVVGVQVPPSAPC